MSSRFAILVVAYNRTDGFIRLLNSLANASYSENVDLIISIDYSGTRDVLDIAKDFAWLYGDKIIREFESRQGLRKHILSCGNYLSKYQAIVVLEDDLIVSPAFFEYTVQTIERYYEEKRIAGISLYSFSINVNINKPFIPQRNQYDVYYQQLAQSWGQIWLKKQWKEFMEWYNQIEDTSFNCDLLPRNISQWPASSWLKYHDLYCVMNDKFFVYPYVSLTSCFSEKGEHALENKNAYQVPMMTGLGKSYSFPQTFWK